MVKIGLTGGIGSGKSTVAKVLECLGYPVYIADARASQLMESHPGIRHDLEARFGAHAYGADGRLNKRVLADTVFEDKEALADINRMVHPRVMEDFRQWSGRQDAGAVFFESAILFEAGLAAGFDAVVCVTAPLETRLQRVVRRDRTTPEKVMERIRNQADDTEKCRRSDFIIRNDGREMVLEQVLRLIEEINNKK